MTSVHLGAQALSKSSELDHSKTYKPVTFLIATTADCAPARELVAEVFARGSRLGTRDNVRDNGVSRPGHCPIIRVKPWATR
jgi:hypothetical protein